MKTPPLYYCFLAIAVRLCSWSPRMTDLARLQGPISRQGRVNVKLEHGLKSYISIAFSIFGHVRSNNISNPHRPVPQPAVSSLGAYLTPAN